MTNLKRCALVILVCVMAACSRPGSIIGQYSFEKSGTTETLELLPDNQYRQYIVADGQRFTNSGRWQLSGKVLRLHNYLVRWDAYKERDMTPRKYELYSGHWDSKTSRIVFDVDNEGKYFLRRTK